MITWTQGRSTTEKVQRWEIAEDDLLWILERSQARQKSYRNQLWIHQTRIKKRLKDLHSSVHSSASPCLKLLASAGLASAIHVRAILSLIFADDCLIDCSFCGADLRSASAVTDNFVNFFVTHWRFLISSFLYLQTSDLTNANLEGANLEGANLKLLSLVPVKEVRKGLIFIRDEPEESAEFAGRKEMTVFPYCGLPASQVRLKRKKEEVGCVEDKQRMDAVKEDVEALLVENDDEPALLMCLIDEN
ncbi:FH protein interacting protein FIP2 isoform X2 [Tanacetum coccineum]